MCVHSLFILYSFSCSKHLWPGVEATMLGWLQMSVNHAEKHGEIKGRESHAFLDRSPAKTDINQWFQMFKLTNMFSWNIHGHMNCWFWACGSVEAFKLENFGCLKMDDLNDMSPIQPTEERPNLIWTFHEWYMLTSSLSQLHILMLIFKIEGYLEKQWQFKVDQNFDLKFCSILPPHKMLCSAPCPWH